MDVFHKVEPQGRTEAKATESGCERESMHKGERTETGGYGAHGSLGCHVSEPEPAGRLAATAFYGALPKMPRRTLFWRIKARSQGPRR